MSAGVDFATRHGQGAPSQCALGQRDVTFYIRAIGANKFSYISSLAAAAAAAVAAAFFPLLIGDAMWFGRGINQRRCRCPFN